MKVIKSPQENIEAYLYNDFNIELYESLINREASPGYTDPLIFFNLLFEEFNFFCENSDKYLVIKKYFENKYFLDSNDLNGINELNILLRFEILEQINILIGNHFEETNDSNQVTMKSKKLISELFDYAKNNLFDDFIDVNDPANTIFNFDVFIVPDLERMTSTTEKIKYLIEIKTKFKQEVGLLDFGYNNFLSKCELEIDKLKELLILENTTSTTTQLPNKEPAPENCLNWIGSQTEFIELIKALIENGNIKGTQIEIISKLSNVFNIEIKNPSKLINDLKLRNNESETLFLDKLKKSLFDYITLEKKK